MSAAHRNINEREPRLEWKIIFPVFALMVIGAIFIYSATSNREALSNVPWYRQIYFQQVVWYIFGLTAATAACAFDYRSMSRWSLLFYWLMILLLLLVLIPGIGSARYGARRWIDLGLFQFQPSEFAKIAFVFALAHFLSKPKNELVTPRIFWKGMGLIILPFILIMAEPDLGSALVYLPVGLAMMLAAGVPVRFLRRLVTVAALLVALILADVLFLPQDWQFIKLEDYQRRRLLVYFGCDYTNYAPPDATEQELRRLRRRQFDDSYNIRQALISVGSGGFAGKGIGHGTQNALGFLPRGVSHNDFIFSVIAEESGFAGSMTVIVLYTVLFFSGLKISLQARDRLGRLLAVGFIVMLFSHVFVNIGMNIRLMPVTGIPLPLLSYGGSSVICSLLALGIIQNVYIYRKTY
ncbi:MAG: rod shape-determining protein RodA [Verrucomicrobia bacterium]|nr:rod shape-determining protein RodA [Verrucomicrobiota bacterium]MCF7708139.1 rod shape-determining protein RodA [Verrucomicrobiota bacterium]